MDERKVKVFMIASTPYRSADIITSFLSREYGKMTSIIYGGKRVGQKNSFGCQIGDMLTLDCQKFENKEFVKITSHTLLKHNSDISSDYKQYLFHCYLHELVNRLAHPEHPENNLYDILDIYQNFKWNTKTCYHLIALLLWKIILHSGLGINYTCCSGCGKKSYSQNKGSSTIFRKESYLLLPDSGEIRCSNCAPLRPNGHLLSAPMIKIIWLMDSDETAYTNNLKIPVEMLIELIHIFSHYTSGAVTGKIKSQQLFLQVLKNETKTLPL